MKKSKFGNVDIVVDQPVLQAGSRLTGKILLPTFTIMDKAAIKEIKIIFEGYESTQATHEERSSSSGSSDYAGDDTRIIIERETKEICSHVLLQKKYNKGEKVDSRCFDFQLDVPKHLKASRRLGLPDTKVGISVFKKQMDYAILSYKVKVNIARRGLFKKSFTFEKPVQVTNMPDPVPKLLSPVEIMPKIYPTKNVSGNIYVAVRLPEGTHVKAGDSIPVDVAVINDSTNVIHKIAVSFNEIEYWNAKGYKKEFQKVDLAAKSFGWLGDSVMNPVSKNATTVDDRLQFEERLKAELDQKLHRQNLIVPVSCKEKFQAKLMGTTHELKIVIDTDKLFRKHQEITIPITVHSPSNRSSNIQVNPVRASLTHDTVSHSVLVESLHPAPVVASLIKRDAVHRNVECDGCKQFPLCGVRFYCSQGKHDYCQRCYENYEHYCPLDNGCLSVYEENSTQPQMVSSSPLAAHTIQSTVPAAEAFQPIVDSRVGNLAIWEGAPLPQAKGMSKWIAGKLLKQMGIDPYASKGPFLPKVPFTPAPLTQPSEVSADTLRMNLRKHPDPVSLLDQFMQQPATGAMWRNLFSRLTPKDFGDIVGAVLLDYRQAPVAEKLVPIVSKFTCDHLLETIKQALCDTVRYRMLATLSPYCVDLKTNKNRVKAELNSTEEGYFRGGLGNGRRCG